MGMPAPSPGYLNVDDVLAFPDDGNRYELVYGELLVSPSPSFRHQDLVFRLARLLASYCDIERAGRVMVSPADITWGRADVLVQPDVFVIAPGDNARDWADVRTLSLVAEVLSPSTQQHDRFRKRVLYQERQVGTYWIVDPEERSTEVWTPGAAFPSVEKSTLVWRPPEARQPLVIDISDLLAD